ncbi:MAG: hypothetical protein WD250_15850 [Egibacteraceae bacterium]
MRRLLRAQRDEPPAEQRDPLVAEHVVVAQPVLLGAAQRGGRRPR